MDGKEFGRLKNDEPYRMYIRDQENTINFHPLDYVASKALTNSIKIANMQASLMIEQREKYLNKAHA